MQHQYHKLGFSQVQLSSGSHVCFFYNSNNERVKVSSSFLSEGLLKEERCVVVCSAENEFDLVATLATEISATQALKTGQLLFDRAEEIVKNPKIDVDTLLDYFADHALRSIKPAWNSMRFCIDVNYFLETLTSKNDWLRLEAKVSELVRELPMILLCQIDLKSVSGEFFFDILRTHQFVVVDGAFFENKFIIEPTSFLDMLEKRQERAS